MNLITGICCHGDNEIQAFYGGFSRQFFWIVSEGVLHRSPCAVPKASLSMTLLNLSRTTLDTPGPRTDFVKEFQGPRWVVRQDKSGQ